MATMTQSCSALEQPGWSAIPDQDMMPVALSQIPQRWPLKVPETVQAQLALVKDRSHGIKIAKEGFGIAENEKQNGEAEKPNGAKMSAFELSMGRGTEWMKSVYVEMKPQPALPNQWEQFLNMKTGEMYYVDWSSCKKSKHDPRELYKMADNRLKACFRELYSIINLMEQAPCSDLRAVNGMMHKEAEGSDTEMEEEQELEAGWIDEETAAIHEEEEEEEDDESSSALWGVMGCQSCMKFVLCPKQASECGTCGAQLMNISEPWHT